MNQNEAEWARVDQNGPGRIRKNQNAPEWARVEHIATGAQQTAPVSVLELGKRKQWQLLSVGEPGPAASAWSFLYQTMGAAPIGQNVNTGRRRRRWAAGRRWAQSWRQGSGARP